MKNKGSNQFSKGRLYDYINYFIRPLREKKFGYFLTLMNTFSFSFLIPKKLVSYSHF